MKIKTIIFAAAVALLASCGSSKKAIEETPTDITKPAASATTSKTQPAAPTTQPTTPQMQEITVKQFTADLDLAIGMGSDKYDLGGKVSMKRDQVVRMNLTFMGFIEVGIIEFTPDYILIVNRMGKEYTKAPYNSIDALKKNNITFQSIEAMAWQQLYAKDGKAIKNSELDRTLENLINSNMKSGKKVTVKIEVGKPNTTRDFETYTTVKSSYKEVPAQVLMAKLMSFAK